MQLVSKRTVLHSVLLGPGDIICCSKKYSAINVRYSFNGAKATLVLLQTPTYRKMPGSSWTAVAKKVCFVAATSGVTSHCFVSLAAVNHQEQCRCYTDEAPREARH